jgi:hypothetical protein
MTKCIKKRTSSTTCLIICSCGSEICLDSYYWDNLKYCPNCITPIDEEKKNVEDSKK